MEKRNIGVISKIIKTHFARFDGLQIKVIPLPSQNNKTEDQYGQPDDRCDCNGKLNPDGDAEGG
jgi:hypothetical protein